MSNCPSVEKFGDQVRVFGIEVTPATRATAVVAKIEMTSAARTFMTHRTIVSARPNRNTNWPGSVGNDGRHERAGAVRQRHERRAARLDEAAVGKADEQDEQADARADGPLQGQRHGIHDSFPEADGHQDHHNHALEDDDAHGAGRRQPATGQENATMALMPRPAASANG